MKGLELSDQDFEFFQKLLVDKTGLYFPYVKKKRFELGLKGLLSERAFDSFNDYFLFLKTHPEGRLEVRKLAEKLSVQETSFFRNRSQFEALRNHVIPEIVKKRSEARRYIRIWSAGCSTGEEPYSIAMTLHRALPEFKTWNISILATDINRSALDVAKHGIYNARTLGPVPQQDRMDYFLKREKEVALIDEIKSMVQFSCHNIAVDHYDLPGMQAVDVIFCRNVIIYFNMDTMKKVNDLLYKKLVNGGYLFCGHSEMLWKISDKFLPIEFPKTFIYQKQLGTLGDRKRPYGAKSEPPSELQEKQKSPQSTGVAQASNPGSRRRIEKDVKEVQTLYDKAMSEVESKNFETALSLLTQIEAGHPHYDQAQIARARILADQAKYTEAIHLLNEILKKNSLYEEAYYLLGVLYYRTGCFEKATKMLQKTLYVNPQNSLASYQLAEIYLHLGDQNLARKTFHATLRLLEKMPPNQLLPLSGDLSADLLSQTCIRMLRRLEGS